MRAVEQHLRGRHLDWLGVGLPVGRAVPFVPARLPSLSAGGVLASHPSQCPRSVSHHLGGDSKEYPRGNDGNHPTNDVL